MTQLDTKKMACVGGPASARDKILRCIEKRCEGCNEKIYMSSDAIDMAERSAKREGTTICLVCLKCADPWLQGLARSGGSIEGQESILRTEIMPRIAKAKDDQLHSN